jgi:hypothetical protein
VNCAAMNIQVCIFVGAPVQIFGVHIGIELIVIWKFCA